MSGASKAAVQRSKKKAYDAIQVLVKKGDREKIKQYAAEHGQGLNEFIKDLIYREIEGYEYEKAPEP